MSAEDHSGAGKETTLIRQVSPLLKKWPQSHHHQLELVLSPYKQRVYKLILVPQTASG